MKIVLAIFLLFLFYSCQLRDKEENKTFSSFEHKLKIEESIRQVNQDSIIFSYELGDTIDFEDNFVIDLHYKIKNKKNTKIEYICQTCNHLEFYLIPEPYQYTISPNFLCNATYPLVASLAPGDSLFRTTQLFTPKNSPSLKSLSIDYRTIQTYFNFGQLAADSQNIEKIDRSKVDPNNIITTVQTFDN